VDVREALPEDLPVEERLLERVPAGSVDDQHAEHGEEDDGARDPPSNHGGNAGLPVATVSWPAFFSWRLSTACVRLLGRRGRLLGRGR
jgi:hypothetical protein